MGNMLAKVSSGRTVGKKWLPGTFGDCIVSGGRYACFGGDGGTYIGAENVAGDFEGVFSVNKSLIIVQMTG